MPGRFNSFQRSMLQWTEAHAYNAVHVVTIAGPLDLERVRAAIDGCLESLGLTNLKLDRDIVAFTYEGGPTQSEIKVIAPGDDGHQALTIEIARQVNTGFESADRFNPFRFFVVPEPDAFSLGIAYFHPIADAESVVHLLKRIVDRYTQRDTSQTAAPVHRYPARFDNLLRRSPGPLVKKLVAAPSLIRTLSRSSRPSYRDLGDLSNGFVLFSLPPDSLRSLTAASKAWDVTVNDLFLALLLKSVSVMAPRRMQSQRRRQISIGCIVNLRKDLGLDSRRTFGLFLGSFVISHEVPVGISLQDLARAVREQTRRIKQSRLYLAAAVEMRLARFFAARFSPERRKKLYPKNYPLWGGLTNMNLNSLWDESGREKPPDYLRAVSTGPATPLVLSITTARERIHVGMTYRSTVFTSAQVERIKSEFLAGLLTAS